jgi:hypothetical protein
MAHSCQCSSAKTTNQSHCSFLNEHNYISTVYSGKSASSRQVDGSNDYCPQAMPSNMRNGLAQHALARYHTKNGRQGHDHQVPTRTTLQSIPRQQTRISENAVTDILPYCTTEPPLRQEQVIALSDVVGSIRELVLLALGAANGDGGSVDKLEGAVGQTTASNTVEFFVGEWEVE